MKDLIKDSRVFLSEGETVEYLVIPNNAIQTYAYLYNYVGIKKDDLSHPNKWILFNDDENEFNLPLKSLFLLEDYEGVRPRYL
ncbi:hypothetical protein [Bacillus sp. AFS040349]|uniref:hypothetical protein n=1 Tax=Bacillus sp. AFS040349 TaxID=2033502 RepID=UPI000BFE0E93|nr:hypothetical protein [Bacillus sp. AFS040349]PGT83298.1 hypothetical protein COD11_13260 [Bacillus sp. AFS040349]